MLPVSWSAEPGIVIIGPAATVAQAAELAGAGAGLVDVGPAAGLIPVVRAQVAGAGLCAHGTGPGGAEADVVRDAALAARTGAALICANVETAEAAARSGVAAGKIAVQAIPAGIEAVRKAGWTVLADLEPWADSAVRAETAAAVCVWLGARVLRTRHVAAVRRSADMTKSILGERPPSLAVRGLA